ncbi:MAG: efflux RND transporter permease subunit [Gammaproteobacteria bacterium]|nr:efflux RND transporter permease subunit [Gammaproteobacteria bacterium]
MASTTESSSTGPPNLLGRRGGLAAWSVRHPIGVSMIALSVIVLGLFSLDRLKVDLLPHIIYPEIGIRILDPGVPANIMEDEVTRQLEEQLAITEDAVSVQSQTSEGRTRLELSFEYGKDIDVALRDASTRLDRAKRFLPDTIDPPVIFKRDPSQIPVTEYVISSSLRDPVELRTWMDYVFSKWFLNLPGVASLEIGGGPLREIIVQPDQRRLAGFGLTVDDLVQALERGNQEIAGGPLRMAKQEITGRTAGRFASVSAIAALPIEVTSENGQVRVVRLRDVADVIDGEEDERLRIRLNGLPGVKVSVQKQPQANTVAVVDAVNERLGWLQANQLLPRDIEIRTVSDEAVFVRQAIQNASFAAVSGSVLAMIVVFVFLGDIRRTLIIGSAIPIGIMVAVVLMDVTGLTINIMTLGGLALGVGLLVDNTIVMLENVYRNQRLGKPPEKAAVDAAAEVNNAIVASTSTNLAAVLPFLFIGGLVGLLFRELIATISAAIIASLLVALTLVPAIGARVPVGQPGVIRRGIDAVVGALQSAYVWMLRWCLKLRWLVPLPFVIGLWLAWPVFLSGKQIFIPQIDDGRIRADLVADAGISLDEMNLTVERIEKLLGAQPEVESVFAQVGGYVFGRSQYEATNRGRISVQLVPLAQRGISGTDWIKRINREIGKLQLAGLQVRMRSEGIRGIRLGRGDDAVSIRIQGSDLNVLADLGRRIVELIYSVPGLENARHSAEDVVQELTVRIDRERAAALGLNVESVGRALKIALQGLVVTDFIDGNRQFDVRVRLPRAELSSPRDLETILLFPAARDHLSVYLGDIASVELVNSPSTIFRDRQQRIVEVSGNIAGDETLGEVTAEIARRLKDFELPEGYTLYDGGDSTTLKKSERLAEILLALALFLVLVVMAVQYESLRNPVVILLGVPFAAIGVAAAVVGFDMPISMPLWLGMIMLAGIVVNNSIVLIEYVEIERERGMRMEQAILSAGRLRLRPILMTTLTTVAGMTPLAIGWGEGAEMLQPLAIVMVCGLSFSTLVSLLMVPVIYRILGRGDREPVTISNGAGAAAG